jgi:multiple sugar transport system substrate-binding protein
MKLGNFDSAGREHHGSPGTVLSSAARRRRLGRLTLATAGSVGLAATLIAVSAGTAGASRVQASSVSGPLTMTIFTFTEPSIKPVLAAFEKQYPNVHVTATYLPSTTAYQTQLLTEKLSGNLTDVVETYDVLTPTLETDGIVANLKPYLAQGEPYPQNYWLPNFLASYIPPSGPRAGNVYALPNEADATVIYYNQSEFKTAGLPYPTDNWTWADMLSDAQKLTIKSSGATTQWGICDRPDWQAMYNPMLRAFGVTAFTETKATLSSPAALKAWQYLLTPEENGSSIPYSTYLSEGSCDPFFDSGQAAMAVDVRGDLPTIRAGTAGKFNFNVVPMPFVPGVHGPTRPTGAGSVGWSISTQAKHIPAALAFYHFLFSAQGQAIGEKTYGIVPAEAALLGKHAIWRTLPGPPANTGAFTTAALSGLIAPQTPNTVFNLTETAIPKAIEEVLAGQSLSSAMTTLNTSINDAYHSS